MILSWKNYVRKMIQDNSYLNRFREINCQNQTKLDFSNKKKMKKKNNYQINENEIKLKLFKEESNREKNLTEHTNLLSPELINLGEKLSKMEKRLKEMEVENNKVIKSKTKKKKLDSLHTFKQKEKKKKSNLKATRRKTLMK